MVLVDQIKAKEKSTMQRRRMNGKRDGVEDRTEMDHRSWCSRRGSICPKRRWLQQSEEVS
jgi:hypothetical protein